MIAFVEWSLSVWWGIRSEIFEASVMVCAWCVDMRKVRDTNSYEVTHLLLLICDDILKWWHGDYMTTLIKLWLIVLLNELICLVHWFHWVCCDVVHVMDVCYMIFRYPGFIDIIWEICKEIVLVYGDIYSGISRTLVKYKYNFTQV